MCTFIKSLIVLVILSAPFSASAAELSKSDATKLLQIMGNRNVVVAGIVNGIGIMDMVSFSSSNVAMVIGYGEENGNRKVLRETFFYDKDLGWFMYIPNLKARTIHVWSTSGYREFKPSEK